MEYATTELMSNTISVHIANDISNQITHVFNIYVKFKFIIHRCFVVGVYTQIMWSQFETMWKYSDVGRYLAYMI